MLYTLPGMLRNSDTSQERPNAWDGSVASGKRPRSVRLLLVHNGDRRLAALDRLLGELGYDAAVLATAEEARNWLDSEPPPDTLITTRDLEIPLRGLVFGRECLARYPLLHAVYVTWIPWGAASQLVGRERVLAAPFTAAGLAAAIAPAAAQ